MGNQTQVVTTGSEQVELGQQMVGPSQQSTYPNQQVFPGQAAPPAGQSVYYVPSALPTSVQSASTSYYVQPGAYISVQ